MQLWLFFVLDVVIAAAVVFIFVVVRKCYLRRLAYHRVAYIYGEENKQRLEFVRTNAPRRFSPGISPSTPPVSGFWKGSIYQLGKNYDISLLLEFRNGDLREEPHIFKVEGRGTDAIGRFEIKDGFFSQGNECCAIAFRKEYAENLNKIAGLLNQPPKDNVELEEISEVADDDEFRQRMREVAGPTSAMELRGVGTGEGRDVVLTGKWFFDGFEGYNHEGVTGTWRLSPSLSADEGRMREYRPQMGSFV